jgi:hypothetical protein
MKGAVAQRLEQGTHNPLVVGSNPTGPTMGNVGNFQSLDFFNLPLSAEGFLSRGQERMLSHCTFQD